MATGEYVPKFQVGEVVRVHEGSDREFTARVEERRVHAEEKNSFYRFDNGKGAWEFALSHTTYKVPPSKVFQSIVSAFPKRPITWSLHVVPFEHGPSRVTVEANARGEREPFLIVSVWTDYEGLVECIGPFDWYITEGNRTGSDPNLGATIAATYNTCNSLGLLPPEGTSPGRPSDYEWDQLPPEIRDRLDPGSREGSTSHPRFLTAAEARAMILQEYGSGAQEVTERINKWLARGDGMAIYRNMDLGSSYVGALKIVSFGSPAAQIAAEEAPTQLPDIGQEINFRFRLYATYRGETL